MDRPGADENNNEPDADKDRPSIPGCGLALLGLYFGGMYRPRDPSHLDDPRFRTGKRVGLGVGFLLSLVMLIGSFGLTGIGLTDSTSWLLLSAPLVGMMIGRIGGGLGAKYFFTSSSDSAVKAGILGAVLAILIVTLACALLIFMETK